MAVQKHSSKTKAGEKSKASGKANGKAAGKTGTATKSSSKLDSLKNLVFGSNKKAASSKTEGKKKADRPEDRKGDVSHKVSSKSAGKAKAETGKESTKAAHHPSSSAPSTVGSKSASPGKNISMKSKGGPGSANSSAGGNLSTMPNGLKKPVISAPTAGRLNLEAEAVCREVACEGLATTGGYCRLHYIKNWKKIKRKEVILREKKLNQYIEELVAKYPDKYIEAIRQDLASDKDFAKVIYDLDLDEGVEDFDMEGGESVDSLIDSIKRDFDDEADSF
jgi:hypothetical protein